MRVRPGLGALAFAVSLVSVPLIAPARAQAPPPDPGALASKVEEYMDARVKRDHFSGSVLIARDGKVLFSRGYGMANLEHDVPNTPQTKFRLGSITKQFTAMADPDPPGAGQAEGRGQGQEIPARRPQGLGRDHDPPPAHPHLGHPQLHGLPGVPQDPARAGDAQGADRQVQGQAARLQAGREVQVQQLRLRRARPGHRDGLGRRTTRRS